MALRIYRTTKLLLAILSLIHVVPILEHYLPSSLHLMDNLITVLHWIMFIEQILIKSPTLSLEPLYFQMI